MVRVGSENESKFLFQIFDEALIDRQLPERCLISVVVADTGSCQIDSVTRSDHDDAFCMRIGQKPEGKVRGKCRVDIPCMRHDNRTGDEI
ncbi:hypothetical protein D3C81_2063760 [compost metagenome]